MSDREPTFPVNLHGQEIQLTRQNTSLFTHLGAAAVFNHIYVVLGEGKGTYIPTTASLYPQLEEFLRENNYPRHEDLLEASETDMNVLMNYWTQDIKSNETGVPEGWGNEKSE